MEPPYFPSILCIKRDYFIWTIQIYLFIKLINGPKFIFSVLRDHQSFYTFCYPVLTCILCHQRYPTRHYGFCLPCRLCRHNPLTHNDKHYLLKFGVRAFMWMKKLCKCRSHICICNYVDNLWMIGWMRLFFFLFFLDIIFYSFTPHRRWCYLQCITCDTRYPFFCWPCCLYCLSLTGRL